MAILVRDVEKLHTWLPALNSVCRLKPETPIRSPYEELFKRYLLGLEIESSYEPFSLAIRDSEKKPLTYTPDFVTRQLKINGRLVTIEPHMMYNHTATELNKKLTGMSLFRSRAGGIFYLIVVSDIDEQTLRSRAGTNPSQSFDEYWQIPTIHPWPSANGRTAETEVKSRLEALKSKLEDNGSHLKCQARG